MSVNAKLLKVEMLVSMPDSFDASKFSVLNYIDVQDVIVLDIKERPMVAIGKDVIRA